MIENIILGAFLSGLVGVFLTIFSELFRRKMNEKREKRERERNLVFSLAMLTIYLKILEENYDIASAFEVENISEIGKKNNIFLKSVLSAFELVSKDTLIKLIEIIHETERLRLKLQFTTPSKRERYKERVIQLLGKCNDILRNLEEELKIGIKISNYTVSIIKNMTKN